MARKVMIVTMLAMALSRAVYAQDREPSFVGHALKSTFLDPSTYAPAGLFYDATMRDWKTSQPFFRNGFVEHNSRFTRSGFSNDIPISYEDGRKQILIDSLVVLGVSAVHNFTERLIQHGLKNHFSEHKKKVLVLGIIERSAVATIQSFELAAPHYYQWRDNVRLAQQMGLR